MKIVYSKELKNIGQPKQVQDDYICNSIFETETPPPQLDGLVPVAFDTDWIMLPSGLASLPEEVLEVVSFAVRSVALSDMQALTVPTLFAEWAPDTAYQTGTIIRFADALYRIVSDHTSQADWLPDKEGALYSLIKLDESGYELWIEPTGAHNAYTKGARVKHNDIIWESLVDGNTWEPGTDESLWKEVVA